MILLIRMKAAAIRAVKTTLNSIMFLLILIKTTKIIDEESFKFHYVSINSEMFQLLKNGMENFKFHYVSINSVKITNCV